MGTELANRIGDGDRRPSTERLENQLQVVSSARVGENQVTWTIFGIFWATQVLLVGVLFQGSQFPPDAVPGFSVSVLGVFMSVAWALTQHRSLHHLQRHEDLIKAIEEELVRRGDLLAGHQLTMCSLYKGPPGKDRNASVLLDRGGCMAPERDRLFRGGMDVDRLAGLEVAFRSGSLPNSS